MNKYKGWHKKQDLIEACQAVSDTFIEWFLGLSSGNLENGSTEFPAQPSECHLSILYKSTKIGPLLFLTKSGIGVGFIANLETGGVRTIILDEAVSVALQELSGDVDLPLGMYEITANGETRGPYLVAFDDREEVSPS